MAVIPDELLLPQPLDLAAGRDPVLTLAGALSESQSIRKQPGHFFRLSGRNRIDTPNGSLLTWSSLVEGFRRMPGQQLKLPELC